MDRKAFSQLVAIIVSIAFLVVAIGIIKFAADKGKRTTAINSCKAALHLQITDPTRMMDIRSVCGEIFPVEVSKDIDIEKQSKLIVEATSIAPGKDYYKELRTAVVKLYEKKAEDKEMDIEYIPIYYFKTSKVVNCTKIKDYLNHYIYPGVKEEETYMDKINFNGYELVCDHDLTLKKDEKEMVVTIAIGRINNGIKEGTLIVTIDRDENLRGE